MRCIRLRPEVSKLSTRPRAQLAIHGAAVAALVPALIWLVPESRWDRPGLLLVLIALAVIADFNEIPAAQRPAVRRRPSHRADRARRARPPAGDPRGPRADRRRRPRPPRADHPARQPRERRRLRLGDRGRRRVARGRRRLRAERRGRAVAAAGGRGRCASSTSGSARASTCRSISATRRPRCRGCSPTPCPPTLCMVVLATATVVLVGPLGLIGLAPFALIAVLPQIGADVRRAHAAGRRARSADRDAPLRARAGAAPGPEPLRAPPPHPRRPARVRAPRRDRRPDRLRAPDAARSQPRVLGGRATSASGGTAAAARPGCAGR